MSSLNSIITTIVQRLTGRIQEWRASIYFVKGMYVYGFIKLLLTWPVASQVVLGAGLGTPSSWWGRMLLAPSIMVGEHVFWLYGVFIAFLIYALFTRLHYIKGLFYFWMCLNLFRLQFNAVNGSDYVWLMMSLWSIPLQASPLFAHDRWQVWQRVGYHAARFLVQWQVVLIYLVSGWDKLCDPLWRSGEAFEYIRHLGTMFRPSLVEVFERRWLQVSTAWFTIIVELAFVVLIWFRLTRLPMLVLGVLFHLGIWYMLSIPDFAWMMIFTYPIFLKEKDYAQCFRRSPKI